MFNKLLRERLAVILRTARDTTDDIQRGMEVDYLLRLVEERDISVSDMAGGLLPPDGVFDTALPQGWVDAVVKALGPENSPVGHFVWSYVPMRDLVGNGGYPYPITEKGRIMAGILAAGAEI